MSRSKKPENAPVISPFAQWDSVKLSGCGQEASAHYGDAVPEGALQGHRMARATGVRPKIGTLLCEWPGQANHSTGKPSICASNCAWGNRSVLGR